MLESSFPSINIGSRQNSRERASNVVDVPYDVNKIYKAINYQINRKYKKSNIYGDGSAGKNIARILSRVDLSIKKKLSYIS